MSPDLVEEALPHLKVPQNACPLKSFKLSFAGFFPWAYKCIQVSATLNNDLFWSWLFLISVYHQSPLNPILFFEFLE